MALVRTIAARNLFTVELRLPACHHFSCNNANYWYKCQRWTYLWFAEQHIRATGLMLQPYHPLSKIKPVKKKQNVILNTVSVEMLPLHCLFYKINIVPCETGM